MSVRISPAGASADGLARADSRSYAGSVESSYSYTKDPPTGPAPPEMYIPRAGSDLLLSPPDQMPEPQYPEPTPLLAPVPDGGSAHPVSSHVRRSSHPRSSAVAPPEALRVSAVRSDASLDRRASTGRTSGRRRHTATINFEDVLSLFLNSRNESKDMRRNLKTALEKLESSRTRTEKFERLAHELANRVTEVSHERSQALKDASAARQELGMYKLQYENAQRELQRGNQKLQDLEAARDEAEEAAARARETARQVRTMLLVERAKEEGRQEGFRQGMHAGGRAVYHENDEYEYDLEDQGRKAREAMDDILDRPTNNDARSSRRHSSPIVPLQTPRQQPPPPPPPPQPMEPPQPSLGSQPSPIIVTASTQESFFTPSPAPRGPGADVRRRDSMSTTTTTTLPIAPSNFPPPTSAVPRMPMIPEASSQRSSMRTESSVPNVVNTEASMSRRDSVRRSRPPSTGGTPRAPPAETQPAYSAPPPARPQSARPTYAPVPPPGSVQPTSYAPVPPPGTVQPTPYAPVPPPGSVQSVSYAPVPPPGSIDAPAAPSPSHPPTYFEIPRPPSSTGRPSSRHSMRGVGSPSMTTAELQRLAAENRHNFAQSRQSLAATLRDPPPGGPPAHQPPRSGPPPRWQPQVLNMPAQLAQTGPPPHAPPSHSYARTPSPDFRPSSRGHSRSVSMSSPRQAPLQTPSRPTQPARPAPRPIHRHSTSTGTPNINIEVESPSDPELSFSHSPGLHSSSTIGRAAGAGYLSPLAPTNPDPPSPSSPSPTSTTRQTPQSSSHPLPHRSHIYASEGPHEPQRLPPTTYSAPADPYASHQQFPPRVHSSQPPQDVQPPYPSAPRMYGDAPTRPRSRASQAPPPGSPRDAPLFVPPPGASPRVTSVPMQSVSSSSGIGSGASPRAGAVPLTMPHYYGGQQPVPIPPRTGTASPAPLPVPSPERGHARLTNAGATPGAANGVLPPRSPATSATGLPPGSPARAPSPLRGQPGSLYAHWDSRSVEDMGDMAGLAIATSSAGVPRVPAPTASVSTGGRKASGSRRR